MKTNVCRLFLLALFFIVSGRYVHPQNINIYGTVKNGDGAPLNNVNVSLKYIPSLFTNTNASGYFNIVSATYIDQPDDANKDFYIQNGILSVRVANKPISVFIFNINGQLVKKVFSTTNCSFQEIDLRPYVSENNIYLVRITVAEAMHCIKLIQHDRQCMTSDRMAYRDLHEVRSCKNTNDAVDTLIFTLDQYNTKRVGISSYVDNVGEVIMHKVNAPAISAPSSSSGTFIVTMSYTWNSMLGSTSDRYELEESTTSGSSGFAKIDNSIWGERPATYQVELTRSTGVYYYRARVYSLSAFSSYSNVVTVTVTAASAPSAPSNLTANAEDPKTIRLHWNDNSSNETGFEIQRETSEGSGQYATITTTNANANSYADINLSTTSLGYRIRSKNGSASSAWTQVAWAPIKLRIINNLYNGTTNYGASGTIDWGKLNNLVRVRIGPTQDDVLNYVSYEKLEPRDNSYSFDVNYIQPAYNSTPSVSNYEDFDLNSYGYGQNYSVYMQCGWWEYDAMVTYSWIKRVSNVLCDNGTCCCYKWVIVNTTGHTAGYNVIKAADFLPHRNWNGI